MQKIGFKESIRLLSMAVARVLAARDLDCYGIAADTFWAESLFQGLLLEELATVTGGMASDIAETAGLLRYVGRLAINQSIQDLGVGLFWDGSVPVARWELEQVGFTQDYAAATLMRAWRFPEQICDALEKQGEPDSDWIAQALYLAAQLVPSGTPLTPAGLERNALPDSDLVLKYELTVDETNRILLSILEKHAAIRQTMNR